MKYRPEIDGLRTIAVLPVVLFHAGFEIFSGGFVGVDIFFVISGYLITTILIGELEDNRFSIARFYERRARRILPALFLIMAVSILPAWLWMFPEQFEDFCKSLIAVTFFGSNILFWREEGYFAPAAEEKPLLHTWSLAVEEQYYVLFPVFLFLAWRFGRNRVFWTVVILAAISLALSEWGWRNKPSSNFYLAPTRAWELFAGSICAFLLTKREAGSSQILSLVGLGAILFAIFGFDETTPVPSLLAVIPVGGTALVILFGGSGTWVRWLLSKSPFVGIGLISYSLYLWHQPLFAFARLRSIHTPSHLVFGLLAVLSIILAWLTWKFVEQPFRRRPVPILASRSRLFGASAFVGILFVGFGSLGILGAGLPDRLPADAVAIMALDDRSPDEGKCQFGTDQPLRPHPVAACMAFLQDGQASVMFLGDSHAQAMAHAAQVALKSQGISSYSVTYAGCLGLSGYVRVDQGRDHLCDDYVRDMLAFARTMPVPPVLVITAAFRCITMAGASITARAA